MYQNSYTTHVSKLVIHTTYMFNMTSVEFPISYYTLQIEKKYLKQGL